MTPAEEKEQSRKDYIAACEKIIQERLVHVAEQVKRSESTLRDVSQTIVQENRKLEELRPELSRLKEALEVDRKKYSNDFEHLISLKGVKRVALGANGVLSVFTKTIFVTVAKRRWELGDYEIKFFPNGILNILNLRIQQLTKQNYYQHPHVFFEDGRSVCLGNIQEGVFQLIAARDYAVATQILIDFLHTINQNPHQPHYLDYLRENWKPLKKLAKKKKVNTIRTTKTAEVRA